MNERIIDLYEQASSFASEEENPTKSYKDRVMLKFAELIVQECINEIAYIGKANEVFGDRTDRGGLNHILWTTETAIEKIKETFRS